MKKILATALLVLGFLPIRAGAQQVLIDDFAFLTGFWTGTGLGGQVEEVWMPPQDGRMFGIFKLSNDAGLRFTEFMEITEVDGQFVLRLKHFNPDFSGWEAQDEHVTFRLESVAANEALFRGLTYRVTENDALEIEITLRYDDGRTVPEKLLFTRQTLQAP